MQICDIERGNHDLLHVLCYHLCFFTFTPKDSCSWWYAGGWGAVILKVAGDYLEISTFFGGQQPPQTPLGCDGSSLIFAQGCVFWGVSIHIYNLYWVHCCAEL